VPPERSGASQWCPRPSDVTCCRFSLILSLCCASTYRDTNGCQRSPKGCLHMGGGGCRRGGGGVEPGHNILQMNEVIRTDTTIYIVVRAPRVFGTEAGVAISKLSALIQADSGWLRPPQTSPPDPVVGSRRWVAAAHTTSLFSNQPSKALSPVPPWCMQTFQLVIRKNHLLSVSPLILVRPFRCTDTINSPRLPCPHRWSGRWGRSRT